jgi:hypothetical protein
MPEIDLKSFLVDDDAPARAEIAKPDKVKVGVWLYFDDHQAIKNWATSRHEPMQSLIVQGLNLLRAADGLGPIKNPSGRDP